MKLRVKDEVRNGGDEVLVDCKVLWLERMQSMIYVSLAINYGFYKITFANKITRG